jgi:hypothetical protein
MVSRSPVIDEALSSGEAFLPGDAVRVTLPVVGMPAGSEGVYLSDAADQQSLVSFWDGGPLRVPRDAVELVERPGSWGWLNDPRD